jgi:hypothetical protein
MKRLFSGIIIFVLLIFLARVYFGAECGRRLQPRSAPLQGSQNISIVAPRLKLVGELEGIIIQSMILEDDIAFIIGGFDELENDHLLRFNTETSQEEWRICSSTNVMALDETRLYIHERGFIT